VPVDSVCVPVDSFFSLCSLSQPITSVQRRAYAAQHVISQSRVCSEAHRPHSTLSANHECAAKRTGRTARYQPITSVQRSAQAEQHVISQSRVCSEADRQNSTLSANHECAAKRTGRTARYQPITSVQRSAQAEQLVSAERYDKVFGTK